MFNVVKDNGKYFLTDDSGEYLSPYTPKYTDWTEEDYANSDLKWCEPMTAHALEDDEGQNLALSDEENFIEEKFDGTRGTLHILKNVRHNYFSTSYVFPLPMLKE